MVVAPITVRRLRKTDAVFYRDIRLESLKANPEAFGSTFETEVAQPLGWFAGRLGGSVVLGAFRGGELLGVAGFAIQQAPKKIRHKGILWGMYVRPGARRDGLGRRLVDAILDLARQSVELIQLTVVSDNEEARGLYTKLGFVEYGLEKNALKFNGRCCDEILMAKVFQESSS